MGSPFEFDHDVYRAEHHQMGVYHILIEGDELSDDERDQLARDAERYFDCMGAGLIMPWNSFK